MLAATGTFRKGDTMKQNVKAALLSAFILPGVGQIFLGRRLKGGILILLVSILLLALFVLALVGFRDLIQAYSVSGGADSAVIRAHLRGWLPAVLLLGGALAAVWIYGIVDALRGDGGEGAPPGQPGD
jgi:TM2 domain-containing membrane protein YozV